MLQGKTALVTGSTSGIGLGVACRLAAQGANVVLNGFGDAEGPKAEVATAGKAHGVRVGYHGADMSKPAEIEAMMAYAAKEFGGVDVLVNNAGIQHTAPVHEFPVDKWDAILALNLTAAFHAIRLALPGMLERGHGRIAALPEHGKILRHELGPAFDGRHARSLNPHVLAGVGKGLHLGQGRRGALPGQECGARHLALL